MTNVLPIPLREPLFAEPLGRPGDWWEPIGRPAGQIAADVRREAAARRLSLDLAVALLVEHGLVMSDVTDCDIPPDAARSALASAAASTLSSGPGRLHTSYVRMLRMGELDHAVESERQLARRDLVLPLRLHGVLRDVDLGEVCQTAWVEEAISWEIAAATEAQFMRDWVLRILLAKTARERLRLTSPLRSRRR